MNSKLMDNVKVVTIDLSPKYESQQSYYNKAQVTKYIKGGIYKKIQLYSYNTLICTINSKGQAIYTNSWDYSLTTLNHLRDFIYQYSFMDSFRRMRKLNNLNKPNLKKIAYNYKELK